MRIQYQEMTSRSPRSLKQEYDEYVLEEIENYKDSIPRSALLSIGDEAVAQLSDASQFSLTELVLVEEVDRIIRRRLRIPAYPTWRRRRLRLLEQYRDPKHWGISPETALVREIRPTTDAHVLIASTEEEGTALYLAANGCEVTAVDREPAVVQRVLAAAGAAGLQVRAYVAELGSWIPDVSLSAVVCRPAAFSGLSGRERRRVIEILQSATLAGGVHLVDVLDSNGDGLDVQELERRYDGWQVEVRTGGAGRTFVARKVA